MSLQRCEQMGDRELQGIRDTHETQDREVALALLNLTEVRGIQACSGGKCQLGKTLVPPGLADGRPKEGEQGRLVAWLQERRSVMCYRCIPNSPGGERVVVGGRGNGGIGVQPCKQPGGGDLQGMGYAEQRQHRNIASPLFNLANIPVTYTSSGGECRLGQASLLPVLPEGRPKTLQWGVLRA